MGVGGVRIAVTEREAPVFGGVEFGAVEAYERLHGTVFGELDRVARDAQGNVEYQSDFRILKPLDRDRGNRCLVDDVPNRGDQPIMPRLSGAPDGGTPYSETGCAPASHRKSRCAPRCSSRRFSSIPCCCERENSHAVP